MELFGDVERIVAEQLYPLRVPLAILGVAGVLVLVLVGRRRGWFAAARRHPVRSLVATLALVGILTPVTWYLASPLFIRIELDEPAPAVVAGLEPTAAPASGTAAPQAPATDAPTPTPAASPSAAPTATPAPTVTLLAREGRFRGADDFHFGRGRARLIETEPGRYVVRFEDFAVRNGPDLFVYLSPRDDGYAKTAIELGRLRATDGNFNTSVPEGTDVSKVRSVVIWCKQFSVQFAVARLDG